MSTTTFPTDKTLPNTDSVIRQIDCQYSFGKERVSIILKFKGDATEVASLAASYREGTRVKVSDLTSKFTELSVLPTGSLEVSGKVTQSNCTTATGCATASIAVSVPYKSKMSLSFDEPDKRIITTWAEKSTDYEFGLEVYAGEGGNGCADAGDFEGWKNEKNKNIQNYKEFKYLPEGATEPVELEGKTLELAQKFYAGIESVRRAYPEVIRTTQYFNYKADEDNVDNTLIQKIKEKPKLYYRDQTPNPVWQSKFENFDWLKASYDVTCEPTEYAKLWNMTITETWLGIDTVERGTWDDNLYGADGTRWKFAVSGNQAQASADGNPVNGNGRVNPTTFQNQNNIKNLDLNNAYTAVDANSFKANPTRGLRSVSTGIPDLETITMPAVSFIGDDAFNGAANLKSINLTNYITYMGERVFQGCTSMTEAVIEPWIYDLPASTFEGCTSLDAPSGSPLKVGGLVKTIGASAFKDCTSLTSVSCENAITSVGANAFENDEALTSFTMGLDSTGSITIGDEAFKGCEALADIELPVPTITLGTDSFLNAFAEEVTVKAPKSFLTNLPGTSSYNYIYPAFVTSIATEEFRNDSQLKSVVIPSTITTLGNNSFRAPNLESVVLSASITSSGTSIFQGCSNLQSLVIDSETLTTLNVNFALNCTSLTDVTITSPLTTLSNSTNSTSGVFRGCSSLTDIDFLPETVEDIGGYAFGACSGLVTANLPPALTTLRSYAFNACTSLKSAILPENEQGTLTLGNSVFNGCSALERVDLPVGTLTVGSTTFNNALASECWIKAPFNSNLVGSIPSGKLVNYIYPSFTTSIASAEWQNNTNLKSVAFPDAVTSLGDNSFNGCTSLESVSIGAGITSVGNYVFQGCSSLTDVTLGENETMLGIRMFFNCTSLETLTIPATVTNIRNEAFRGCTSLEALTIPLTVTTFGTNIFQGVTNADLELTFTGRTIAEVQALTNYPWGLATAGQTIHCSDGDITI